MQIGAEDGRLIEPSAFDVAFNGSFAVADAPNGRERVQMFDAAGVRTGGFILPGRGASRVVLGSLALNGVGTLAFTGRTLLMSHPESGWLITEYALDGSPLRSIGQLRKTGHESDRDLHLALNAGSSDRRSRGRILFRLHGRRSRRSANTTTNGTLDLRARDPGTRDRSARCAQFPIGGRGGVQASCRWWRRSFEPRPWIDPAGSGSRSSSRSRMSLTPTAKKSAPCNSGAPGIVSPSSLWFNEKGRVLVTPGCYEFEPKG